MAGLLLLLIGFSAFVYFHKPTLKSYLEKRLSDTPGLTVKIGRLNYRLFPLRVEMDSVQIGFVSPQGRAEAFIGRAESPGSLRRILKNQRPYFDTLTLAGLKFEFSENPNAPPTGPIDVADVARMVSEYLPLVGRLTIRDASLRIGLPVEGLDLTATGVDLEAEARDRTSLNLTAKAFDFANARPGAALAAGLRTRISWGPSDPVAIEGTLDLIGASLSLSDPGWTSSAFDLAAGLHFSGGRVDVDRFKAEMPGLVKVSGSGRMDTDRRAAFSFTSAIEVGDIERAKKEFLAFLPRNLPDFALAGSARWEGEARGKAGAGSREVQFDGALKMPPARLAMKREGYSMAATVQADLRVSGSPAALRVAGLVNGERGQLAAKAFLIRDLSLDMPIDITGSTMTLSSFKARATELVLNAGGRSRKIEGLAAAGRLGIDLARRAAAIDSLDFDLSRIGRFSLSGKAAFAGRPNVALTLSSSGLVIPDLVTAFGDVLPPAVVAWRPAGRADLSLRIESAPPADRRYRVRGTIGLAGAGFQDSTGSIVSEGLKSRVTFEADVRSLARPFPFSFRLELARGEALWRAVYIDWGAHPLRLDITGEFEPEAKSVRNAVTTVVFPPLGEIRAEGSFSAVPAPRFDTRFSVAPIDLALLQGFLGKAMPSAAAAAWRIEGRAEAEGEARLEGPLRIRGLVKIREGSMKRTDGALTLAGVSADLPFSLSNGVRPGDERGDYSLVSGFVAIDKLGSPALPPTPLRIDFFAARNLFLVLPFTIDMWGAGLGTGPSVLALSPAVHSWRGASRLALDGIDLAALPIASDKFKLAGRARITPGEIDLRPGEIRFRGQILADLFGGRLTIEGLRVTDPFSAGRRIMFQAGIAGLDLGRLTSAVPFGEVTGIVDVTLRDFSLSYGQPERFDLGILSVPAKGIPRKFSLKAVDNLSVISSGGRTGVSSTRGLARFVSRFGYSRIGIACSLRNDVFTLQGTIVEGGVQYLVRRSALFGIDVVNAKPRNTISFKDMIGRLERVGREPARE